MNNYIGIIFKDNPFDPNNIPPSEKKKNPKGDDLSSLFPKQENSLKRKNEEPSIPKVSRLDKSIIEAQETLKNVSKRFAEIVLKQTSEQIEYQRMNEEKSIEIYFKEISMTETDRLERAELLQLFILTDFYKQTELHEKCKKSLKEKLSKNCRLFVSTFTSGGKDILQNDKLADFFTELFIFHKKKSNAPILAKLFPLISKSLNHSGIQLCLGLCYKKGFGVKKDLLEGIQLEGIQWFKTSAEKGNACAQYYVGHYSLDENEGFNWFKRSAEGGYPKGEYRFGEYYESGKEVEKNLEEAFKWYRKSAEGGLLEGILQIAKCYKDGMGVTKDLAEAFKNFKICANKGDGEGLYETGLCYKNGLGVEKSLDEAFKYFEKGAEQSHAYATYELGLCYKDGHGVKKNLNEAFKLFLKSSDEDNNHPRSFYELGMCYLNELGVEENLDKAIQYLKYGAEVDDSDALYELGRCYFNGWGVEEDLDQVLYYFEASAENMNPRAQYALSICYSNGWGVEKSLQRASELDEQCKNNDHPIAESDYQSIRTELSKGINIHLSS